MIVDERVLTAAFQPSEILHRHDELSTLSRALRPISDGDNSAQVQSSGAFIWGPTGTGKTCSAAYVVDELASEADIGTVQIDCWQQDTSAALYHSLLGAIDTEHARKRGTTPTTVVWEHICDRLEKTARPFVVVLDEVDQLRDEQALYQFYEHERITPILIANRKHDVFASLDDRVYSRLRGYTTVHFDRYLDRELVAILDTRASAAVRPGVVSQRQLDLIAEHADGDARLAIAILRNALRQADGEFTDADITGAIGNAQTELREATLSKLSDVQRILLRELTEHGEQSLTELYDRYTDHDLVTDPLVKRTIRNHLSKMADYDLVLRNGAKSGRTYESALDESIEELSG